MLVLKGWDYMIHYTCDRCHRLINPQQEIRYSVRIETTAALDRAVDETHGESNHLEELHEILQRLGDADCAEISESVYQIRNLDLCSECHRQFVKQPLGTEASGNVQFSEN